MSLMAIDFEDVYHRCYELSYDLNMGCLETKINNMFY